jgi:amidohydrolase
MKNKLFRELETVEEEMIQIRRHLHQYPEESFKEEKTPAYIAAYHRTLGHDVRIGVGGGGVVATLRGAQSGKTIALRADFDALPVQEETGLPYASKNPGVMHACGHDGHTASLLGLAKALNRLRSELRGTVVFIHQHAEEIVPGGARSMIEDGCLEGVDRIYGSHLWAPFPLGQIRIVQGNMMAASDKFTIELKGEGGHAGLPHETNDVLVTGAQLVLALQTVISRKIDPFEPVVLTIGSFNAGKTFNVIPETAVLVGTVRSYSDSVRKKVREEMKNIVDSYGRSAGIECRFDYQYGFPAVVNPPEEAERVMKVAKEIPGITDVKSVEPMMISEDFGYYLRELPGAFFFTGAGDPDSATHYPHHHPKFTIDERALKHSASVLGGMVDEVLHADENES